MICILCSNNVLFYTGCAEQGQLGRVAERFVARGGRRGLELLLQPDRVHAKNRRTVFADVWAGSYDTLALSTDNEVLVCGLNNYNQVMIYFVNMIRVLVSKHLLFCNMYRISSYSFRTFMYCD